MQFLQLRAVQLHLAWRLRLGEDWRIPMLVNIQKELWKMTIDG
jgi:hypothetical protein